MPNFSTDSDLLPHEPMVFHELPFAGQTKLRVTDATVTGSAVTSPTGGFTQLAPGDVAVIGDGAYPIATITSNTALTLASPPVGLTGAQTLTVRTFTYQAALVHDELLRAVGIDPDDPEPEYEESAIVSTGLMTRLEALGTLALGYAGAVSIAGDSRRIQEKADRYRGLCRRELHSAAVYLDLDGDGRPDTVRHPGVVKLIRS